MLTALATIFAALSGMVPGIIQFFTLKANNAQQLALEQLRLQAAKDGMALQIDLANTQADIQQQQHIYSYGTGASGIKWIDALSVFVRPYITLVFFHMWILVVLALLVNGVYTAKDLTELSTIVWDEDTQTIFGAIMGFWFGNRMMTRAIHQPMAATLAVNQAQSKTVLSRFVPAPAGDRS